MKTCVYRNTQEPNEVVFATGKHTLARPRRTWDLTTQTIREMRTREEKLRAVFGAQRKPPALNEDKENQKTFRVREGIVRDLEHIRLLAELDTWKYIPEEVAAVVFEHFITLQQHYEDGDVEVEHIPDTVIVEMAIRTFRLYLQGCHPWNRKLIPKVMGVDRNEITIRKLRQSVVHGAIIDNIVDATYEVDDLPDDDTFDFDDIPEWDEL